MSEERHSFHISSTWLGNSDGDGVIDCNGRTVDYGVPVSLGGKEGRSNPEEMLIAAVASCYCITLAIIGERKRLPIERIDLEASGEIVRQPDKTLKFESITLRPRIHLPGADEAQQKSALDAAQKAEVYCLVSRALRGSVEISVDPTVQT